MCDTFFVQSLKEIIANIPLASQHTLITQKRAVYSWYTFGTSKTDIWGAFMWSLELHLLKTQRQRLVIFIIMTFQRYLSMSIFLDLNCSSCFSRLITVHIDIPSIICTPQKVGRYNNSNITSTHFIFLRILCQLRQKTY